MPEVKGMNENTYLQWVIDGLGGVTNMLDALANGEVHCTKGQRDQITRHLKKMAQAVDKIQQRVSDG